MAEPVIVLEAEAVKAETLCDMVTDLVLAQIGTGSRGVALAEIVEIAKEIMEETGMNKVIDARCKGADVLPYSEGR
jgi:ferritin-like metal-binding protein YciE